tara:strand:+ start:1190 stop:2143 length:954 start_codon:yes stop_codon:yes gene_type:complete
MSKILIIGAGAMGSAFTFPCIDNGHDITLMGSPLENEQIENLKKDSFHKHLECKLSDKIVFSFAANLKEEIKKNYNFIVIGVNSKGINWISNEINTSNSKLPILLLTKGLSIKNNKLEILTNLFKNSNISAVAGPCLAKDLSKRNKTGVVFTNKNISSAKDIGKLVKTNYYFMDYSNDIIGVEMCAAIKNFYSMVIGSSKDLNTAAILMQKSVIEMGRFVKLFGGSEQTVYGLAGLGDLYVSIAGGRNRKMGQHLGDGYLYSQAKTKFMPNDTVEGAELAFEIGPKILKDLSKKDFPIMCSIIESVCNDKKFVINFL